MTLTTTVGEVELEVFYGQDRETGQWLTPVREQWELGPHQTMTPVLEERLCFTATMTGSYEKAAQVAAKWGTPADDSTIHQHVQKAGQRQQAMAQQRVERAMAVETRGNVVREAKADLPRGRFSLVVMMDGWMARERGPQWGLKPTGTPANRVEWHEVKSAIVFRVEQRAQTQSGRPMLIRKYTVACRADPYEFGRRVYAETLRRGLVQAEQVFVVADGGVWIWNVVEDRFSDATKVLDFYHASEHLWVVARALWEDNEEKARQWVEPLLHQLNHGGEAGVLRSLEDLLALCVQWSAERSEVIRREVQYFRTHGNHLHYQRVQAKGCPKGSGAMESTCAQFQNRFKRTGQFWTSPGMANLLTLEVARNNLDWDEIWHPPPQQC